MAFVAPSRPPERAAFAHGWSKVLSELVARRELEPEVADTAFAEVLEGNLSAPRLAAFLVALRAKGESAVELLAFSAALRRVSEHVELGARRERAVDIVGTGGDRAGTVNVSTLAALVVAGAGGVVCKHGSRAAFSPTGAADLLEALGVAISLSPAGVVRCVEETGFGFCLAARYHPAIAPARAMGRELGVPTVLDVLCPLANPARVSRQVVGVANPAGALPMLEALERSGSRHAMVVYGADGLDELSTTSRSQVLESRLAPDGTRARRSYEVDPGALGLAPAAPAALRGGNPAHNARRALAVLSGERGPQRDFVVLNAAAGMIVAGLADDLAEGMAIAAATLDRGRAIKVLEALIEVSQRAEAEGLV